jgi:hypothetical protein
MRYFERLATEARLQLTEREKVMKDQAVENMVKIHSK